MLGHPILVQDHRGARSSERHGRQRTDPRRGRDDRLRSASSGCLTRDGNGGRICWGTNEEGAIGDGTFTSTGAPKAFATPKWAQLAAGAAFFVGLDTKGAVYAWGLNSAGQLGHAQAGDTACGTTFCNSTPQEVKSLP